MIRSLLAALFLSSVPLLAQDAAQPTLPTTMLTVGSKSVTAEVADDNKERMTGLMFRKELKPDSGMLFVMPRPDKASFWMRNTVIPLSIAYISPDGQIMEIHEMKALDETPVPSHFANIAYALEMEKGWFSKSGVLQGDLIRGLPPLGGR